MSTVVEETPLSFDDAVDTFSPRIAADPINVIFEIHDMEHYTLAIANYGSKITPILDAGKVWGGRQDLLSLVTRIINRVMAIQHKQNPRNRYLVCVKDLNRVIYKLERGQPAKLIQVPL